jgi:hypothetical protein
MHFPSLPIFYTRIRRRGTGLLLGIACLSCLSGLSAAEEVTNLYEASVPVASQDRDQRADAIRVAFTEVLMRVSGRSDITNEQAFPAITQAIQTATRYTQQYRYLKASPSANKPAAGLVLWVRFDETALSRLLHDNHLPVWGSTRPATLLWLVVDDHGRRKLIGNDARDKSHAILQMQAHLRGVPLRFPLLDLTDRANLRVSDVWGNFESTILRASQRYQTEAVLVGRVFQNYSGYWTARWSLYSDGRRVDWTVNGNAMADVLNPGIDKTAESLAVRYAQVDQVDSGKVLVEVKAIKGLADFNRVVKYLHSISHVSDVQPAELAAESAVFRVTIPGGRLAVARAVALGHVLVSEPVQSVPIATPIPPTGPVPTTGEENKHKARMMVADLVYRLVP